MDDDHVLGPLDVGLRLEQVGFKLLDLGVGDLEDWIELHLGDTQFPHLGASFLQTRLDGIPDRRIETAFQGMPENDHDFLGHESSPIMMLR